MSDNLPSKLQAICYKTATAVVTTAEVSDRTVYFVHIPSFSRKYWFGDSAYSDLDIAIKRAEYVNAAYHELFDGFEEFLASVTKH